MSDVVFTVDSFEKMIEVGAFDHLDESARIELIRGEVLHHGEAYEGTPPRVRFTTDSFDRMLDSGVFDHLNDGSRVELIEGEVCIVSPRANPQHDCIIDRLANWSYANTAISQVQVRVQNSIGIEDKSSVPSPDVAWVRQGDYFEKRPQGQDVLLLIEVAGTSLEQDRERKASLYAEAGVRDYWIVNLRDKAVEVHRKPVGGVYEEVHIVGEDGAVSPLAAPSVQLAVASLW